jgi:hypothetical protein
VTARKGLESDVLSEAGGGGGDEPDWCVSHC